jgi:hypothetical protein
MDSGWIDTVTAGFYHMINTSLFSCRLYIFVYLAPELLIKISDTGSDQICNNSRLRIFYLFLCMSVIVKFVILMMQCHDHRRTVT